MVSERIKLLRKALDLTQTEFGVQLGVSRDVISNLEYGRVAPSDLIINMMCAKFGVDDEWLRTGAGTMYREKSRDEEIDYAEAHNVPLKISRETNYSKDKNLWHLSHEGLDLEDPSNEPNLDKEKFLVGLQKWLNDYSDVGRVLYKNKLDCAEIDAGMADSIVQFALFGEEISG